MDVVYESLETGEERVVTLLAECIDEIHFGAFSPVGDRGGKVASFVGRVQGPAGASPRSRRASQRPAARRDAAGVGCS